MHTLEARLTSPLGFAAVVTASILLWLVAMTGATSADNNRGTVKIHDNTAGQELTDPSDERNEPNVCDYTLHWFGGNPVETRGWWVEAWPGGTTVDGGTYTSDANGNASAPQNVQLQDGHYKLFWESSDGHTKHKVFKVSCADGGGGGGIGGGEG